MFLKAVKQNPETFEEVAKKLYKWFRLGSRNFCSSKLREDSFFNEDENYEMPKNNGYNRSNQYRSRDFLSGSEYPRFRDRYDRYSGPKFRDYQNRYGGQRRKDQYSRFNQPRFSSDDFDCESGTKQSASTTDLVPLVKDYYKPHPDVINRPEEVIKDFYDQHSITIFGSQKTNCPPPILNFNELDLPDGAVDVINSLNYTQPTPIQSLAWPIALSGFNMVGISQTGSGKSLGFILPALIHIKNQPEVQKGEGPVALIVAPTRELAQQVMRVIEPFARKLLLRTACLFGGEQKFLQTRQLAKGVDICVATPGRLIHVLDSNELDLLRCTYIVFDEADRLLDMGFYPQIKTVMEYSRLDRQMLMWSATWPPEVKDLSEEFLKDYIAVKFGSTELVANSNITQIIHVCEQRDKNKLLRQTLNDIINKEGKDCKILIFAKTRNEVDRIGFLLREQGYPCATIHSGKTQQMRNVILRRFREGSLKILIGSLVVGRGLDINDIKYVINYDFPVNIEDYVHIIGRTGRCNNYGTAHTFFTYEDAKLAQSLVEILRGCNQEINSELLEMCRSQHRSSNRNVWSRPNRSRY